MSVILVLIVTLPLAAAVLTASLPGRSAGAVTIIAGVTSLALALLCVPYAATHAALTVGILHVDALSTIFVLATAFLYALCAVYSIGYLADEGREAAVVSRGAFARFGRYRRRYYVGINAFCWAMLCAPLMSNLALLWVSIEVTTVVSALLVAIVDSDGAVEAAWKYVLIASSGLGIALLGTIVMYYAASTELGADFGLSIGPLAAAAHSLPAAPVRVAFLLAVVGFGTKVGLFPVHTWLPDAHAEAPTPVSALLSGSLLADSFYAILRYYQVAVGAVGTGFTHTVLLFFGIASLLLAALCVLQQRDIKRMLAYSSIEHMGILAIGVGFGAPLALFGVLLHVLAHAAAKGSAFLGAGVLVRKYGTKSLARIRGGLGALPWSAPLFLMAIFALSAIPPFGIFRSEFDIVVGGLADGHDAAAAVLIVLVTLAFAGLAWSTTRMLFLPPIAHRDPELLPPGDRGRRGTAAGEAAGRGPAGNERAAGEAAGGGAQVGMASGDGSPAAWPRRQPAHGAGAALMAPLAGVMRGEPSVWMVVPVVLGVAALVLLGAALPDQLLELLKRGADELMGIGAS